VLSSQRIVWIEVKSGSDLKIGEIQSDQVQAQYPRPQADDVLESYRSGHRSVKGMPCTGSVDAEVGIIKLNDLIGLTNTGK